MVETVEVDALSGYLFKKARNDKWQRRWFETQGFYLVYYKNRKMEKLLAALSLPQVGESRKIPADEDPEKQPGLFALELNNRVYTLRAQSNEEADMWVKVMLKLREQGQQQAGAQNANDAMAYTGGVAPSGDAQGYIGTEVGGASPVKSQVGSARGAWVKEEKKPMTQKVLSCCPC